MGSAFRVSPSFLNGLKALFPENTGSRIGSTTTTESILRNPWYIVAAVAFSASNRPEAIPRVFEHVLEDIKSSSSSQSGTKPDNKLLAQKLREALFKSGLIAINGLKSLHEAMPEELRDTKFNGTDPNAPLADYEINGQSLWRSVYGEKADSVQGLLTRSTQIWVRWFSKTIGYPSALETSYTLVAALIAGDTPQQIAWHLDGAQRGGASFEEVRAVRELSIRVAEFSGVQWRHTIPEVEAAKFEYVED
ncbi:hypothetical protein BJ912DRAFT_1035132 [Pholiota molesta]|nr:hypothetical protein BJ912DRAFT_1035132 [Pholiota molesta]